MRQEDNTYQTKLNELRLDLSNPNSKQTSFIFVEGETDIKLFRKLFNSDTCKVEWIVGGNAKLEQCVATLLPQHSLIVAIRDADFLRITTPNYAKQNIILTDCHDIEMTMIHQSTTFTALMSEYAETLSISDYETTKQQLLKIIAPLSLLKLINEKESIGLKFKKLSFQDLLDFDKNKIDIVQCINRVLSKSDNPQIIDTNALQEKIDTLINQEYDLFQLTNGHDIANVLAKFLNDKHKNGRKKNLSDSDIESMLRMIFNKDCFEKTQMYQELKNWEKDNNTKIFA